MHHVDFDSSEKCLTLENDCVVKMDLVAESGEVMLLKENISLLKDEIIDSMFMSKTALCEFGCSCFVFLPILPFAASFSKWSSLPAKGRFAPTAAH